MLAMVLPTEGKSPIRAPEEPVIEEKHGRFTVEKWLSNPWKIAEPEYVPTSMSDGTRTLEIGSYVKLANGTYRVGQYSVGRVVGFAVHRCTSRNQRPVIVKFAQLPKPIRIRWEDLEPYIGRSHSGRSSIIGLP